jgi:hypothetical protein
MTLSSSVNGGIYGYMDGARAQGGGGVGVPIIFLGYSNIFIV